MSARQFRARLDRLTPPATTAEDLSQAVEDVIGKGELARLLTEPADKLITELERLNLVTQIVGEKLAQARAVEIDPLNLAKLGGAISNSLLALANTIKVRQSCSQAASEPLAGSQGKLIEHDELGPFWQTVRQKLAQMDAA